MVLYLVSINFALRGGSEHKNLCRPGFDPQITYEGDDDGFSCLVYRKHAVSKTNQGGLLNKYSEPCVVYC